MGLAAKHLETNEAVVQTFVDNAVVGLNAGFEALAKRNGVDPKAAGEWISKNYADTAATVLARHWATKDARVWAPLLRDYKASRTRR